MSKIMTLEHLKASAAESKNYIIRRLGSLAGTVAEALEEQVKYTDDSIAAIEIGGTQVLRGTNTVTALTSTGTWDNGTWRRASAGSDSTGNTRTSIAVEDAPNANIKVGWEIARNGTGSIDIAQDGVPVANGQTYTLSCYAKGTGVLRLQYGKNPYPKKEHTLSNVTKWTRYSYTFTIGAQSDGSTSGSTNIYLGAGGNGTIQICGMMLETGNVATDWTPAPEDLADKSSAVSVTIPATGWSSDSDANYPKYYDIAVSGVTAADRAEVTIAPGSIGTAIDCGLCPTNETLAGKIRIRSASVPKAAISAEYWIENGKE